MRLFTIAGVILLAGCNATMPQQSRPTAADDPSAPCFRGIPVDPRLATIAGKIPLDHPRKASLAMLASTERPTDAEKAELSLWAKYRAECTAAGRSFRARYAPPGWATAMEDGQVAITQAIATLYAGGTYGQFNSERQRLAMQMQANMDSAARNAQQSAEARQAAERAANLQALQTMQLLQVMQPKPMPINPTVNCTSFRNGNVTNTSCN